MPKYKGLGLGEESPGSSKHFNESGYDGPFPTSVIIARVIIAHESGSKHGFKNIGSNQLLLSMFERLIPSKLCFSYCNVILSEQNELK